MKIFNCDYLIVIKYLIVRVSFVYSIGVKGDGNRQSYIDIRTCED